MQNIFIQIISYTVYNFRMTVSCPNFDFSTRQRELTCLIHMAAVLLLFQQEQNVSRWTLLIERLLADPDDVFRFDDKMLINRHR